MKVNQLLTARSRRRTGVIVLAALLVCAGVASATSRAETPQSAWRTRRICAPLVTDGMIAPWQPGVSFTYAVSAAGRPEIALRPKGWTTTVRASWQDFETATCQRGETLPELQSCRLRRSATWTALKSATTSAEISLPAGIVIDRDFVYRGRVYGLLATDDFGWTPSGNLDCTHASLPEVRVSNGESVRICRTLHGQVRRGDARVSYAIPAGRTVRIGPMFGDERGWDPMVVTEAGEGSTSHGTDPVRTWVLREEFQEAACPADVNGRLP